MDVSVLAHKNRQSADMEGDYFQVLVYLNFIRSGENFFRGLMTNYLSR